ncbi:FtsX-like permease family protein [Onishia niordana]|uniref:FtsX-like permease family protein n=1 Tax=Onishia niordana TaxID=2508711 RepID=UPI001F112145|nr:FtsX-like permease family protein [Halomonas niordiana]
MPWPNASSLAMVRTALVTLLSHYRRHPGQLAMLLVGLWVASALWSGVQAINASARDSYARAEALLSPNIERLERRDGEPLAYADFATLRREGLPVAPLIEGEIALRDGERLPVLGIDPLSMSAGRLGSVSGNLSKSAATASKTDDGDNSLNLLQPPGQTRLAPETLASLETSLDASPGARLRTASGARLPPLVVDAALPPGTLVLDIARAAELLERGTRIDGLLLSPGARATLPEGYRRTSSASGLSPGQLTESFHLNLTALGLLSLVVGLLIVHAALGLALEQRLGLLRTLRALGVPGPTLVALLAVELVLLGLAGTLPGLLAGLWLARVLLPDVAASLEALFSAPVGATLSLPWHFWAGSLAMTLGGLATAGLGMLWRTAKLDILALGHAQPSPAQSYRRHKRQAVLAAIVWLAALVLWVWPAPPGTPRLIMGFAMVALMLAGSALCLPVLLAAILEGLKRWLKPPSPRATLARWALADLQLQLPRLQLAMMALLLALATNLGVAGMVGGFRLTFLDWLDQRLVADLYLRPPPAAHEPWRDWLETRPEITTLLERREAETRLISQQGERPVSLQGLTPVPALTTRWPLLATRSDDIEAAWQALRDGEALINEQLSIATGLSPGDTLTLASPDGPFTTQVAAVYPDYGNPRGEVTLTVERLITRFAAPPGSLGLVLAPGLSASDKAALRQTLTSPLPTAGEAPAPTLIDQQTLHRQARQIFERTFAVTQALTALTLGVAALSLFTSLLAQARERRTRLAPLWALGLTRTTLLGVTLAQLGGLALATALLALPLGLTLNGVLIAEINVAAFGWRLPLHVFPASWAEALGLALLVALLAAALPAWRLWRAPPRQLLEEFNAA